MSQKIVIFDDNNIHLESLKYVLNENYQEEEIETVVESHQIVDSLSDGTTLVLNLSSFNTTDSIDIVDLVVKSFPQTKILVISKQLAADFIKKLYCKGIKGFLDFKASLEEFLDSVKHIMNEEVYVNEQVKDIIYKDIFHHDDAESSAQGEDLTKREFEVLELICEGLTTKEIGEKLFISVHTVETHKRKIMQKFDVHNSTSIMKYAYENNILLN